MNYSTQNDFVKSGGGDAGLSEAEHTLRVIARLPAPEGLEDRVQAGVHRRQLDVSRTGSVLEWPALRPASGWMRVAAAAAIVFVVAGGGWGVYSRVEAPQTAKVIVMPPRVVSPGGFSNAGAMRTPNTLNGPVVTKPAANAVQTKAPVAITRKAARRANTVKAVKPSSSQAGVPSQK